MTCEIAAQFIDTLKPVRLFRGVTTRKCYRSVAIRARQLVRHLAASLRQDLLITLNSSRHWQRVLAFSEIIRS